MLHQGKSRLLVKSLLCGWMLGHGTLALAEVSISAPKVEMPAAITPSPLSHEPNPAVLPQDAPLAPSVIKSQPSSRAPKPVLSQPKATSALNREAATVKPQWKAPAVRGPAVSPAPVAKPILEVEPVDAEPLVDAPFGTPATAPAKPIPAQATTVSPQAAAQQEPTLPEDDAAGELLHGNSVKAAPPEAATNESAAPAEEPRVDEPSAPSQPATPSKNKVNADDEPQRLADKTALQPDENLKIEVVRERYPNTVIRVERQVTQDEQGNFVNHGTWIRFDERSRMVGGGEYKQGRKEGKWTRWFAASEGPMFSSPMFKEFSAPFTVEAHYVNDQLAGTWRVVDSKGRKAVEWNFQAGQPHGKNIWYHVNGLVRREIPYVEGEIEGIVYEYGFDGKVENKESFAKGRRLALQTDWYGPNVKRAEGWTLMAKEIVKPNFDFWNGTATYTVIGKEGQNQRHGVWTWWHKNAQKQMEGRFESDQPEGLFTWWYSNGQKQLEGEYTAGKQEGKYLWWHNNGVKMMEGEYVAGAQINTWMRWNEDGQVRELARYSPEGEQLELKQYAAGSNAAEPKMVAAPKAPTAKELMPETIALPIQRPEGRFKR